MWVRVLESLAHRGDLRALTMLAWAEVLPWSGLLRSNLAWCPDRLREQATAYEPLLWCIKAVDACPWHRRMLHSRCPHCSETQRWRAARGVQRKQVLSDEVRRVAVSLHEAGREPTLREVASRLTTPGSMQERVAREVLAQIRLELGPVRR